jgi:mRNA interferase MazF
MPDFRPWDIVKVPFPYTDRPILQRRPALVLAVPPASGGGLLWVLMITSAENRGWPGDVAVAAGDATGLPVASVIRVAKIATIDALVAAPLGRLSPGDECRLLLSHIQDMLALSV